MNYAGKFDVDLSTDGAGSHPNAQLHVDSVSTHVPPDAIIVPEANLLFNGDFKRSGVDLVLSKDGHELVVQDYFKGEHRAPLASPDGAHLTGNIVSALSGDVQYSQAGGDAAAAHVVIGHVSKLSGSATATRNGVSIVLNNGDNVEKGDVVATGSDSTLGVTFIDGTVFGLSHNARMVLNEMVYDPNGSNNSSLLSLVAGTISFVAGETAKHGDMKVDTPVATMGIRGTAVLCEIDFDVQSQNGLPDAKFQVLVEPDGHAGSYVLLDKATGAEIARVDKPGTQTQIDGSGNVSFSSTAPLSFDAQKVITDVFSLKFTDLFNSNTKTTTAQTDSIVPFSIGLKLPDGTYATAQIIIPNQPAGAPPPPSNGPLTIPPHADVPPTVTVTSNAFSELPNTTGSTALDIVSGTIGFNDINLADRPTAKATFFSFAYQDAHGNDFTTLDAQQQADITTVETSLAVIPNPDNTNAGTDTWTYSIPDHDLDFLAAGETLTLTYKIEVDTNYAAYNTAVYKYITVTVTGTNDAPVINTGVQVVPFAAGTSTVGGNLQTTGNAPTSGTLVFTDVDLTDTHTVSVALLVQDAELNGSPVDLTTVAPGPLAIFETALTASLATDSTGTGTGTINWTLAKLPVYLADFVPAGETLELTYAVTVTDEHGASSTQDVDITIQGTNSAAEVWIATTASGTEDWNTASNWETGRVPTASDDAIIVTNQLNPNAPLYPVTIDAPAFAHSVTMNDFVSLSPVLDNNSTLTIGAGGFSLNADSILNNSATGIICVAGAMDVEGTSHVNNYGTITLAQGGDFGAQSAVTNVGKIEVSGGTLSVEGVLANSDQFFANGTLQIDLGATLALEGATVAGGTVTYAAVSGGTVTNYGTLDLQGAAAINNGELDNTGQINVSGSSNLLGGFPGGETVSNSGAGFIDITGDLTLNFAGINNSGNSNGETVEKGASLTLFAAANIDGGTLTNIGTLTLDGAVVFGSTSAGATLTNGILNNTGQVNLSRIDSFDNETITNSNIIEVLALSALTIDLGSTIANAGGTLQVDSTGTLTLDDATVTGGTVTNNGTLDLAGTAVIDPGVLGNTGHINVSGSGNALDGESVTNFGTIEVLASSALTIDQGSTIANSDGTVKVDATGTLTLNDATVTNGTVTNNGTLDLTGTAVIDTGVLGNTGHIDVSGSGNALDEESVTNSGTIEVLASGALTIDRGTTVANTSGTVKVDSTGTLTLDDATVTGGTVTNNGTLDLTGTAVIDTGVLGNAGQINVSGSGNALDDETVTNSGVIEVLAIGALTIDQGSTIANADGTVKVDATGTLTLNDATVTGGTLTNNGTLDSTGGTALTDVGITNSSLIESTSGTLTISSTVGATTTNSGTLEANGGELDITSENVTNTGTLQAIDDSTLKLTSNTVTNTGGAVTVGAGSTLDMIGASINGGTLGNSGTLNSSSASALTDVGITNSSLIESISGTLTITSTVGATTTNSGTLEANGGELDITSENITNTGTLLAINDSTLELTTNTVTNTGGTIEATGAGSTVELNDVTIAGGTLSTGDLTDDTNGLITVEVAGGANTSILDGSVNTVSVAGYVQIEAGANLELIGTIDNSGVIDVDANGGGGATTSALEIHGTVTLNGAGTVTLDGSSDQILAASGGGTLDNYDMISGAGAIGHNGDGALALNNELGGTIEAIDGTLTVDTGQTFANAGTIEAGSDGRLVIDDAVSGTGSAIIYSGGVMDFGAGVASGQTITFAGSTGTLQLDYAQHFSGQITGFGTGDTIDLTNAGYSSNEYAIWTQSSSSNGGSGTLAIYSGTGTLEADLHLNGTYTQNEFALASDGVSGTPGTDVDFNYSIPFTSGTINSMGDYTPQIGSHANTLTLTNDTIFEQTSWFANDMVSTTNFTASFQYQATGFADGISFVLQEAGTSALGTSDGGSGLGYDGISGPSAAVEFNIYDQHVLGTNFATGGSTESYNSTAPVDFWNGDEIQVELSYNGSVLTETLTDLVNGSTFSTSYTEDLQSILGSSSAYVGFTAGTGLGASTQTVSNLTYQEGPIPGTASLTIADGASLLLNSSVATGATVTFTGGTGTLDVTQPSTFHGEIAGFTGTAADAKSSDVIDLTGINYNSGDFSETYNSTTGVLTVTDGNNTAALTFIDFSGTFKFASDGSGGTDIFDPPAANSPSAEVSVGRLGSDNFHFHPDLGADARNPGPPDGILAPESQHWPLPFDGGVHSDLLDFVQPSHDVAPADQNNAHWHLVLQNAVHLH